MKRLKSFPKFQKSMTVEQIGRIVRMAFVEVDPANTPTAPGVYLHATAASHKLLYCGRAIGENGLRGRLNTYRRYVARARAERLSGMTVTTFAPVIAGLAAREYVTYIAVCRNKESAIRREAMIHALHLVTTGKALRLVGWSV